MAITLDAMILSVAAGFVLGYFTYAFLYGCGFCGACWIALANGKRYEDGCTSCAVKINNERYGSGYFTGPERKEK